MSSYVDDRLGNGEEITQEKRVGYIEWDEYFMAVTFLELRRTSTRKIADAAVILNRRKIIISMACSDPCEDTNEDTHAAHKALEKIDQGHMIFTTSFPCGSCARSIVDAGIVEVVYYNDNVDSNKAKDLFDQNGVTYRQFYSKKKKIEIDFSQYCDDNKNY